MSTSTWTGGVGSDWDDPDNWSPAGVPDASSDVTIATGDAVALPRPRSGRSIRSPIRPTSRFESAGTNTVTTFLDNTGHLRVDAKGATGGTILNIGGTLTNSGYSRIGNATLSASDEVTAASLDNTGKIYLTGSSANQALLDVAGSAGFGTAGILSGTVRLAGDSAIEFASGEITSLAADSHLGLGRKRRLHRGQHGDGVEQRSDRARFDRRRGYCSRSKTRPRCRRPARSPMTETSVSTRRRRRRIEPDAGGGADQQRQISPSATLRSRRRTR